jgi:hypothetical protein
MENWGRRDLKYRPEIPLNASSVRQRFYIRAVEWKLKNVAANL